LNYIKTAVTDTLLLTPVI